MTYATLMVHLEVGRSNAGLLRVAGDLAKKFRASIIGIAACQPMQIYGDGYYVSGDLIEQDREEIEKEVRDTEAEFRSAFATRRETIGWCSTTTPEPLADYIACEARSADIVLTTIPSGAVHNPYRRMDACDLIMQAGRPVLAVPNFPDGLKLARAMIAWKDTPETRRAAADALPLLKELAHVTVVEISAEDELPAARSHLENVVGWLKSHGIVAESIAFAATGDDSAQLNRIAQTRDADVIVAGAYGHSRVREWAIGGVTRDLLHRADRCLLLSH